MTDWTFEYQMLNRLQLDCDYFLDRSRNEKVLHQLSVEGQIQYMKELYQLLPEKPQWLTWEEIEDYEIKMKEALL